MKYLIRTVAFMGLLLVSQMAYSDSITDTYTTGDTLTATTLTTIKDAVNDNDGRISTNALDISNFTSMPSGATPGDILYWDGSVWQLTPAPPVTAWIKKPSLFLCDGVPTWSTSGCTAYNIGDTGPAGGIVFYVTNGGHSGLEASREDQAIPFIPGAPWGCNGTSIPGAVGTAIGTGRQNTTAIIAGCPDVGIAARLADEFTFGGFGDWFLPSIDELNELYLNRVVVGGFASFFYWSSSEVNGLDAWGQTFDGGFQSTGGKTNVLGVRAVRAF